MTINIPTKLPYIRMLSVALGLIIVFWMSLEDDRVLSVALLGISGMVLVVLNVITQRQGGRVYSAGAGILRLLLWGCLTGMLANLATVTLMFFKNAWHGHVYLDYPLPLMGATLTLVPYWMLAGAFVGLGLVLLWARSD